LRLVAAVEALWPPKLRLRGLFSWTEEVALERLRVLIAEDETIIRIDLRQTLERYGLQVVGEARDGGEAVALAAALEPDLVLLDVKMPVLDGVEAARRITAERPVPVVLLTAYSDRALVKRAVGAGIFAYLVKPFREQELLPAIETAVARHEELLAARRVVGAQEVEEPVELTLHSSSGLTWPLRLSRLPDGSLDVTFPEARSGPDALP
jgi:AmiR/NasT family two-component response regulator